MKSTYLFIKANKTLNKISVPDISYIEAFDDYIKFHLKDKTVFTARMTMKTILNELPKKQFIRIHRSFIVPFPLIKAIGSKKVILNEHELPLGTSYVRTVSTAFKKQVK